MSVGRATNVIRSREGATNTYTETINVLKFKSSDHVDGGLIREIKQGRKGVSLKLNGCGDTAHHPNATDKVYCK